MALKKKGMIAGLSIGAGICILAVCTRVNSYSKVQEDSINETIVMNGVTAFNPEFIAGLDFDVDKMTSTEQSVFVQREYGAVYRGSSDTKTTLSSGEILAPAADSTEIETASLPVKTDEKKSVIPMTDAAVQEKTTGILAITQMPFVASVDSSMVLGTEESKEETEESAETEPPVDERFANLALTVIETEWLNIRSEADAESEILGKMYPGSAGQILEENNEWTKISSGSVEGWVSNEYIAKRAEAQQKAQSICEQTALVNTEGLRVRQEASTDSKIIGVATEGKKYTVVKEAPVDEDVQAAEESAVPEETAEVAETEPARDTAPQAEKEQPAEATAESGVSEEQTAQTDKEATVWVQIEFEGEQGYVAEEFVTVDYSFKQAISIEEEKAILAEEARKEAERKAAEKKAAEEKAAKQEASRKEAQKAEQSSKQETVAAVWAEATAASYDETTLLAALVEHEAGGYSYEGQLAVANVVLNRLRSGRWGNSITSVIFAKSQFSGVNNGALDKFLNRGVSSSCMRAAQDALAGSNNIGDYMFFCSTRIMNPDAYSSYVVIGGNCFYKK